MLRRRFTWIDHRDRPRVLHERLEIGISLRQEATRRLQLDGSLEVLQRALNVSWPTVADREGIDHVAAPGFLL